MHAHQYNVDVAKESFSARLLQRPATAPDACFLSRRGCFRYRFSIGDPSSASSRCTASACHVRKMIATRKLAFVHKKLVQTEEALRVVLILHACCHCCQCDDDHTCVRTSTVMSCSCFFCSNPRRHSCCFCCLSAALCRSAWSRKQVNRGRERLRKCGRSV